MALEWAWLRDRPDAAAPNRELVLGQAGPCSLMLFHGLTGTPRELGYIAHYIHARGGFNVWCPPLANHGQPLGVLAKTSWQELYEGARASLLQARDTARTEQIPLVIGGLSIGAILSLLLAADFPDDVAGVVCLSPTLFFDGWNVPWTHRLLWLAELTRLKHFAYLREDPPYGLKDEVLRKRVAQSYDKIRLGHASSSTDVGYAHFPVRLLCEMKPLIRQCIRRLPSVKAQLLVVQAVHDESTSIRNAHLIHDRVGSISRKLVLLNNCYHVITSDLQRAEVAQAVTEFCQSIVAPASGS